MSGYVERQGTAVGAPGRVGQGTAVEQSRAVAEVQAAVMVAQQLPRVQAAAVHRMQETCKNPGLAKRAFYSFPRGGQTVSGPTIRLAKELARCWGNVHYGLNELRRDDEFGQSEMQAWAWDLESNQRVSTTFIVPHLRTARGKTEKLTDTRDIYELNTNNGNRRLREMIFSVLPEWYVDEAQGLCTATLKHGGGVPLAKRAAEAIEAYQQRGITRDQLEQQRGRKVEQWTDMDLAQLDILYQSIGRGEITVQEAFPPARVTAADLTGQPVVEQSDPWAGVKYSQQDPDAEEWVTVPSAAGTITMPASQVWPEVAQPGGES
jgi:hypothetical protein